MALGTPECFPTLREAQLTFWIRAVTELKTGLIPHNMTGHKLPPHPSFIGEVLEYP